MTIPLKYYRDVKILQSRKRWVGINKEVKNRYEPKVIRGGVDTTQDISGNTEHKLTIGISEEINRRDVNTVRRSLRRAEPRSSDPIQWCRAATRKSRPMRRTRHGGSSEEDSARIRWSRCGLVLIGSTSWIVDDGLDPVMRVVSATLSLYRGTKLFSALVWWTGYPKRGYRYLEETAHFEIFRSKIFTTHNTILDILANWTRPLIDRSAESA